MMLTDILLLNQLGTKKQVKKLMRQGLITLDDEIINQNIAISKGTLKYRQQPLDIHPLKYIALHKPCGYLCDAKSAHPVDDLIPYHNLSYVGRLDRDTSGLLLLTNDHKLRKKLILPQYHIPKTYLFTCLKPITETDLSRFSKGIVIDQSTRCRPAIVKMYDHQRGTITIDEGKYHEIRKMFMSIDNRIVTLKRISFGRVCLNDLAEGQYRSLSKAEISQLKEDVNGNS